MKLWTQTLAWLAAVVVAVLLAWAVPEGAGILGVDLGWPQGAAAPR